MRIVKYEHLIKEDIAIKLLDKDFSIDGNRFTPEKPDFLIALNGVYTDYNVLYVELDKDRVVVACQTRENSVYYMKVEYKRLYTFDIIRY